MLTLNDLHDHFASIPKNFDLTINNQNYKCNKQVLCTFSKVISTNSQKNFTYSCDIPTNDQAVNTVIDFLHGGNVNFSENTYEIYLIAAYLDISILKPRLNEMIELSTTKENFDTRYNVLSSFPNYCDPLFKFFAHNKDYFYNFTKSHIFSLPFANFFLASNSNFFISEDEKVNFILAILQNAKDNEIDDKNLSIVSHINLCNLDEKSLYSFLEHPLSSKFSPYLNVFPLFDKQMNIISINERKLADLTKEINEVQSTYENEKNTNDSLSNEFNSLSAQSFNLDVKHYSLKQKVNEVKESIKEARSFLQVIQQRNSEYLPFLEAVDKMNATSINLVNVLQNFYNIGGKTIYPGSSRDALKHSKEWNEQCVKLKEKIPNVFLQEQLDKYFKTLDETEAILQSLISIENQSPPNINKSPEDSSNEQRDDEES